MDRLNKILSNYDNDKDLSIEIVDLLIAELNNRATTIEFLGGQLESAATEAKRLKARVKSEQGMKSIFKTKVEELSDNVLVKSWIEKSLAKTLHDRMVVSQTKTLRVLTSLAVSGRIDLKNKEIADLCFVTSKSVVNYKAKLRGEHA